VGRDRNLLTLGSALVLYFGGRVFGVLSPMADQSGQNPPERKCYRQEGQVLLVMLATLWLGLVNLALFIGKSHALGACLYLNNLTTVSQVTCMIGTCFISV